MPIISAAELGSDEFEDKTIGEGLYDVRIAKAEKKRTKKDDRDMVTCMLVIDGDQGDGISPFNEFLLIPNDTEEVKTKRMFMQRLIRFCKVFGVTGDFDPDDAASTLTGLTARVPVIEEEGDEGVVRNRLKLPRVS